MSRARTVEMIGFTVLLSCSPAAAPPAPPPAPPPPAKVEGPGPVAAPVAPPADAGAPEAKAAPPPLTPMRTLRYRELSTGMLPRFAFIDTWTLLLAADGRAQLDHEKATAANNTLRVSEAKPLGPITITDRHVFEGRWLAGPAGAIDLRFDEHMDAPIRCRPGRARVLAAGALLVVPPHQHAPWRPSTRSQVDVLQCERAWAADEALWSDEPQPKDLLLADAPGIEYAHCNDDMVIQQGALRRLEGAESTGRR